jgi:hypothetical protein
MGQSKSGLQKLNDLVTDLHQRGGLVKNKHPIVLGNVISPHMDLPLTIE